MKRLALITVILISLFNISAFAQTEFKLKWQAKRLSKSCFTVTKDENNVAGAIWWPNTVDLTKNLDLHFLVYMGDKDAGADGLGFVFHNDPAVFNARGDVGGGLYFGKHPSQGNVYAIQPSVAIEIDTYRNTGCASGIHDPRNADNTADVDHTTVVYNGDICNPKFPAIQFHKSKINIEDNTCYPAIIKWRPGTGGNPDELSLYVDGEHRFTYTDYMVRDVFANNTNVYYGFTGSTGGARNEQTICIFEGNDVPKAQDDFASTPYGTPVDVDVQANDGDSDGDDIFTNKITVLPHHGTATILARDKVRYAPYSGYAGLDSLQYEIVDIDPLLTSPDKCYVNRTQAWVYFNRVQCPTFTLMAEKRKDNDKCDVTPAKPDNGTADAYMWDGTKKIIEDFKFKWYKGTLTAAEIKTLTPDFLGSTVSTLPEGPYTIAASLSLTDSCQFNLAFVTIDRTEIKPDYSVNLVQASTMCDPANGVVQVVFTDPLTDTTKYTFKWYEVFPTVIGTYTKLKNLHPKKYTVSVTNNISGCSELKDIVVPNLFVSPAITTVVVDRTSCATPNGKLSANISGNTIDYEFRWGKANDKKLLNPYIGAEYNNLDTGVYYVTAKDLISGCPLGDTLMVKVKDLRANPVIYSFVKGPQTSCDPSTPNGTIELDNIDNNKPLGNYTYNWFIGDNTITPLHSTYHSEHKAYDLSAGLYTVQVVNKVTGCSTSDTIRIKEEIDAPELILVNNIAQSFCSPMNGRLTVNIDPDGTSNPKPATTNNYTFEWWKGETVTTSAPDYTGFDITGLKSGKYVVRATSSKGCQVVERYTVGNSIVMPTITFTTVVDNTTCDPTQPNGSVAATVGGIPAGVSIKYEWFNGNNTNASNLRATTITTNVTESIVSLPNNIYTLKITNQTTGCSVTKFATVNKVAAPTFTLTATPTDVTCNNSAGGADGSVSATPSIAGTYIYRWYKGEVPKATADFTGQTWNNIKAGKYTVVAQHSTNYCKSPAVTVTVGENLSLVASIPPSSTYAGCVDVSASLTVNVNNANPHEYFWFTGDPDLTAFPYYSSSRRIGSNSATLTGLSPNKYVVWVRDLTTNCIDSAVRDLTGSFAVPYVKLKTVDNNIRCDMHYTGKIEIEYIIPDPLTPPYTRVYPVAGMFPANIDIYWINGAIDPSPVLPTASKNAVYTGVGTGLPSGNYGLKIGIVGNPCLSGFIPATIYDVFDEPILSVTRSNQKNCPPNSSVAPDGKLKVRIHNYSTNISDYAFEVKQNGTVITPSLSMNVDTLIINNLGVGNYEVKITKSACPITVLDTIYDDHITPIGTVSITDQINCNPADGAISVDPYTVPVNYTYNWYLKGTDAHIGSGTSIINKEHNNYYLVITDNNTHCTSDRIDGEILDNRVYPTIVVNNTTPKTMCNAINDGTALISFGPKLNSTDYTPHWTLPSGVPNPVFTASVTGQSLITNLDSGKYILKLVDNITGCETETVFNVGLKQNKPELKLAVTDNTNCAPLNGKVVASVVSGTGTPAINPIKWGKVVNGAIVPQPAFDNMLTPPAVEHGEYVVWAESDNKGCPATLVLAKVIDKTPKININLVGLQHQSSCDSLSNPNGAIAISVSPSSPAYQYRWYKNGNLIGSATTPSIAGLTRGKYVIEVTSSGCVFKDTFNIRNIRNKFVPVVAKQNVKRCLYPYDGLLAASVNGGTNGFTFRWTNLDSAKVYPTNEARNLPVGKYSLNVINTATNCDTTIYVSLDFDAQPFDIMVNEDMPVTNCDMSRANGQMSANVNGEISGYQFDWYETASPTASTPVYFSGSTVNILKPLPYTLRVTNLVTGCSKDQTVTPLHLPVVVAAPVLDSLRNVTSCKSPNGYAEVSAGGSNANHIFKWYIGTELKAIPDFTGYAQENLEIGDYLVTATDRLSGCISSPIKVTIGDEKIFVDIKAGIKNSLCHTNNGEASITWIEPVGVATIQLSNGMETISGSVFENLPHGDFHITLETEEGCVTEKDITIGADWLVFNGVSPNDDGNNDFLSIDCIELFTNNTVKIFNRAGALVYVGEGYDNEQIRFEGSGNRGVYTTGNRLPDGTYYYVVDPGDGRKPKAGFFELLR